MSTRKSRLPAPIPAPGDAPYAEILESVLNFIAIGAGEAAAAVNRETILAHWRIGRELNARISKELWGEGVAGRLAADLKLRLPGLRGYAPRTFYYMRQFAAAYPDETVVAATMANLPWRSNIALLERLDETEQRLWYAQQAVANGWSSNVLITHIGNGLHRRLGAAPTNFAVALSPAQSDLAQALVKDRYNFDFLGLPLDASERAVEAGLLANFKAFLTELHTGFAYAGNQYRLVVGGQEFFLDLVFYHVPTHRWVVFELKIGAFEPEFLGKLGFYVNAVDDLLTDRHLGPAARDNQTIGILLCRESNGVVVDYSLRGTQVPMGVATYSTAPAEVLAGLPTEAELIETYQRARTVAIRQQAT